MQASFHIRYQPADVIMIDFAGKLLYYFDKTTGEQVNCPVLVCVLPFSNYTYVEALPNARLPALLAALNNCLRYFNGVPLSLKTDNVRQVVQKANRYEPTFTELIQHGRYTITPPWSQPGLVSLEIMCDYIRRIRP